MINGLLPEISDEQRDVINKVLNNNNVIVDSVAGSGKTTTSLQIGINNMSKNILLLTYNSRLKMETRQKVKLLNDNGYENMRMDVHSYHSFNVKYYGSDDYTDIGIVKTITKNILIKGNWNTEKCDIIILDEAQDITETFYKFICKIFKDVCYNDTIICVLGDKNQSIFDFNGADNRYLTCANNVFNFNDKIWTSANLSTSYRITRQIANFINNNMLSYKRLNAIKDGKVVRYMILNIYEEHSAIHSQIMYFINNGYTYSDIFILAPSVKSETTPAKKIANYLSITKGINIYVSGDDNESINEKLLEKKLVISTFHQVKGLERKIVFVLSFDNSYFEYYKNSPNVNTKICPNELYVSNTRSIQALVVIHQRGKQRLPFLNIENIHDNCSMYHYKIDIYRGEMKNTSISNMNTIYNVNLNYYDYINNDIIKCLLDNIQNIQMIKYILLPTIDKYNNMEMICENIKEYIDKLLTNGYTMNNIQVITRDSENRIFIEEIFNYITENIDKGGNIYGNETDLEMIKIILYYDFSGKSIKITPMDVFYIKHIMGSEKITSFKIYFGQILTYTECCVIGEKLYMYTQNSTKKEQPQSMIHFWVTNLCKYLPTTILSEIINILKYNKVSDISKDKINIKWNDKQNDTYENVCSITGVAIPALFEYYVNGNITIINKLETLIMNKIMLLNMELSRNIDNDQIFKYISVFNKLNNSKISFCEKFRKISGYLKMMSNNLTRPIKTELRIILMFDYFIDSYEYFSNNLNVKVINELLNSDNIKAEYKKCVSNILRVSNFYNCISSGYYHLLKQIKYYNWLTMDSVRKILKRLVENVSNKTIFEYRMITNNILSKNDELGGYGLCGIMDCYDIGNNILWEFKCVNEISADHYIQLALYAYLLYNHSIMKKNVINNDIHVGDMVYYLGNNSMKKKKVSMIYNNGKSYKLEGNVIVFHDQIVYNETSEELINYNHSLKNNKDTKYYLFNIFSGEIRELSFDYESIRRIVGILKDHKVSFNDKISDEQFMKNINNHKIDNNKKN